MRKKNPKVVIVALLAGIVCTFAPIGSVTATTVVAVDTQYLTNKASAVVLAAVESQESRWNEAGTKIYTFTVLDVQDDFKGKTKGKKITVKQLGGTVGDIGCYVAGQAPFRVGEKVLVFLRPSKTEKAHFRVVGMAQGKYSVLKDGTAVRDLNGLNVVGAGQGRAPEEAQLPVDQLIEKVRAIVSAEAHQGNASQEGGAR